MNINTAKRLPASWLITFGLLALCTAAAFSITIGPIHISISDSLLAALPSAWWQPSSDIEHLQLIVQQIRLPRTILAITVGAILATSGAVMQGIFRNPLADPSIIGVSAGSALGAAVAIVLLAPLVNSYPNLLLVGVLPLFAFVGGIAATFIVYRLGTGTHNTSVSTMLLAGVAISALASAGLGLMHYFADDQALRSLSIWTLGSLSNASWSAVIATFSILVVIATLFYRDANRLNVMLLGEPEARHMGINVQTLKRRSIFLTAAGVGVSVAMVGIIGFVGLVVPHMVRIVCGPNYKTLLPLAMITGALLLLIADIIARTVIAPLDLPVGIVTALIGAPFFIYILVKQRGHFL